MVDKKIQNHLENIIDEIVNDLILTSCTDFILTTLFDAYNRYQEDERDSVDYIFNLENKDDIFACLNGGMTTNELQQLFSYKEKNDTCYFMFGANYPQPHLLTKENVVNIILNNLKDIVKCIIAYPFVEEYQDIFEYYISDNAMISK